MTPGMIFPVPFLSQLNNIYCLIQIAQFFIVTTRPPREGEEQMNTYTFVSREYFEEGIRQNKFLEFGEKDGNL